MSANKFRAVNQSIPTWTWGITVFFYFSAGIAMDSKEEKCCLCKRVFESSNMKKKRRRLHGQSAEKTRSVLNVFCIENIGLDWMDL